MPGENDNGINEYTGAELAALSPDELVAAQRRGFTKPLIASPLEAGRDAAAELQALKEHAAGMQVGSSVPAAVEQPQDAGNVWARKRKGDKDFTCPSGQKCRLRKLDIEKLMMAGVLDQVTRLEGLAQTLVNQAEGQPPTAPKMPSREDFAALIDLVNVVVPMAVAEPALWADDDPTAPQNAIRVSDVDLTDRLAILNEALAEVKMLDNFRPAG